MTEQAPAVVLGKPEIAALLGVDRSTPAQWIRRREQVAVPFPEPDHPPVYGLDVWRVETIVAWAVRTDRMPKNGRQ